jgi:hypothetical protein
VADLIHYLERFNRKERYFLVKLALGGFNLGEEFRAALSTTLEEPIPSDAFVAMDYHLEWIYAALWRATTGSPARAYANTGVVVGNQEDVDLLIAWADGPRFHLGMIEAKLDTPWSRTQIRSKANRLARIFEIPGALDVVKPHFVFLSPKPPTFQSEPGWATWIDVGRHVALQLPHDRLAVSRSDEFGRPLRSGTYWTIVGADD